MTDEKGFQGAQGDSHEQRILFFTQKHPNANFYLSGVEPGKTLLSKNVVLIVGSALSLEKPVP